jgi:hypothetical protein
MIPGASCSEPARCPRRRGLPACGIAADLALCPEPAWQPGRTITAARVPRELLSWPEFQVSQPRAPRGSRRAGRGRPHALAQYMQRMHSASTASGGAAAHAQRWHRMHSATGACGGAAPHTPRLHCMRPASILPLRIYWGQADARVPGQAGEQGQRDIHPRYRRYTAPLAVQGSILRRRGPVAAGPRPRTAAPAAAPGRMAAAGAARPQRPLSAPRPAQRRPAASGARARAPT